MEAVKKLRELMAKVTDSDDADALRAVRVALPALLDVAEAAALVRQACYEPFDLKKHPDEEDDEYYHMMRPLWDRLEAAVVALTRVQP